MVEAEYKYILKNKTYEDKMIDFFEIYSLVTSVPDCNFRSDEFLNDSESDDESEHSNDDI